MSESEAKPFKPSPKQVQNENTMGNTLQCKGLRAQTEAVFVAPLYLFPFNKQMIPVRDPGQVFSSFYYWGIRYWDIREERGERGE